MKPRTRTEWMLGLVFVLILVVVTEATPAETESLEADSQDIKTILRNIARNTECIERETEALRARMDKDRGICASKNFSVMCVAPELDSRNVLVKAEELRKKIANELLGFELPDDAEFTIIHVTLSNDLDEGVTLLANGQVQGHHRIWLTTRKDRALGSTLAHELAHVVLNAEFANGIPAWAGEGLASSYDDADRKAKRTEVLKSIADSGQWPSVGDTLNQRQIAQTDLMSYTVSTSLTEFCLTQGDRRRFVEFAQDGISIGWDAALSRHYGIQNTHEFQQQWQQWVLGKLAASHVARLPVYRQGLAKS